MVSFIKIFACVGLFGEQARIIELSWGCVFLSHKATLECQRKQGIFWELGGKYV